MTIFFKNPRLAVRSGAPLLLEETIPDVVPESPLRPVGLLVWYAWKVLSVDATEKDLQDFLYIEQNLPELAFEDTKYSVVLSDLSFAVKALLMEAPAEVPEGLILSHVDPSTLNTEFQKAIKPQSTLERVGIWALRGAHVATCSTLFDPELTPRVINIFPTVFCFDCLLEEFYLKATPNFVYTEDPLQRAQHYISLAGHYVARKVLEDQKDLETLATQLALPSLASRNAFWQAYTTPQPIEA